MYVRNEAYVCKKKPMYAMRPIFCKKKPMYAMRPMFLKRNLRIQ